MIVLLGKPRSQKHGCHLMIYKYYQVLFFSQAPESARTLNPGIFKIE